MSTSHTKFNIDAAENMAPKYGMGDLGEARFIRNDLGAEGIGMSNYRINPGYRMGFGHSHAESEEVYVVVAGSGRFKVEDEILDVGARDVVYVGLGTMRAWEAGPDGMELLTFGHHVDGDATMEQGWWAD